MPINIMGASVCLMCEDQKIKKLMCEDKVIYSSGAAVTYHVDTGETYTEEVEEGASCLEPVSFTPAKSGWEFAGWRRDEEASGNVLGILAMEGEPVELYAVFRQAVKLTYDGNGSTEGSMAEPEQTGYRYYNNGNEMQPTFTLADNEFVRADYAFKTWALGSASGTQYAAGETLTLTDNTTMYAIWTANDFVLPLTTSGWTMVIVNGGFTSGPTMAAYGSGVQVYGVGNGAGTVGFANGGFWKYIDTKGKSKVDITVGSGYTGGNGSVSIGSSAKSFFNANGDTVTLSLQTSPTTQKLQICASNYGDTYNTRGIAVSKLYFHD
ncbi:MAG: InlB B-repeat-containing protein [Muribaculaceae bacterium]|nr:InlB B-repeat-containing protein [Acetatifactor muris]MCM1494153.1 InlB B-repeat-containing protein [Muribaculaceae bacterium]MCM1560966.1 InlB B-repeat-containing protein [Butyrivibrio sp.]